MSAITSTADDQHLRRDALPLFSVLAQSVASVGPTLGAGAAVGLIAATAGNGAWVTWLVATVAMLLVSNGIRRLSDRFLTTGGLYTLAGRAWGPLGAFLAGGGVAMINGFAGGPALSIGFAIYFSALLGQFGVPNSAFLIYVLVVANVLLAGWLAYKDIRLSTHVLLVVEGVTMALVVVLMAIVLATHSSHIFDSAQLHLQNVNIHGIFLGLVLAFYSFGGFESCTTFGQEARNPRRTIPIALIVSVLVIGVFFIFNGYVQPIGFIGSKLTIATSGAPLSDLARLSGVTWFQYLINIGVAVSFFSCTLAVLIYTSRMWFTLAREGFLPKQLARVSSKTLTPLPAIVSLVALWFVILTAITISRAQPLSMYGYVGTMAGYGITLAYLAITIGVLLYFFRRREMTVLTFVGSVLALAVLVSVFVVGFYPTPAFPFNVINYIFLAAVACFIAAWAVMRARYPGRMAQIATSLAEDSSSDSQHAQASA